MPKHCNQNIKFTETHTWIPGTLQKKARNWTFQTVLLNINRKSAPATRHRTRYYCCYTTFSNAAYTDCFSHLIFFIIVRFFRWEHFLVPLTSHAASVGPRSVTRPWNVSQTIWSCQTWFHASHLRLSYQPPGGHLLCTRSFFNVGNCCCSSVDDIARQRAEYIEYSLQTATLFHHDLLQNTLLHEVHRQLHMLPLRDFG